MFCSSCGAKNSDDADFCEKCGRTLTGDAIAAAPSAVETVIPYKNAKALVAYYCGVFSLAFCFLGIPALIFGIMGLKYANRVPQARGKVHAWIGIILGSVMTLAFLAVLVMVVSAFIGNSSRRY